MAGRCCLSAAAAKGCCCHGLGCCCYCCRQRQRSSLLLCLTRHLQGCWPSQPQSWGCHQPQLPLLLLHPLLLLWYPMHVPVLLSLHPQHLRWRDQG